MKTQIRYPFVFAVLCFWLGLMLSISFLETPLKFQVPGMTLPVALELGKLMFGVSTNIQLFLTGVIALNLLLVKKIFDCRNCNLLYTAGYSFITRKILDVTCSGCKGRYVGQWKTSTANFFT